MCFRVSRCGFVIEKGSQIFLLNYQISHFDCKSQLYCHLYCLSLSNRYGNGEPIVPPTSQKMPSNTFLQANSDTMNQQQDTVRNGESTAIASGISGKVNTQKQKAPDEDDFDPYSDVENDVDQSADLILDSVDFLNQNPGLFKSGAENAYFYGSMESNGSVLAMSEGELLLSDGEV